MDWKIMMEWKELPLEKIKPGMIGKLVASDEVAWTPGAWIKGLQGKEFTVCHIKGEGYPIAFLVPLSLNLQLDRRELYDDEYQICYGRPEWFIFR